MGILKRNQKEALFGILFAGPAILGFILFTMGPMIASLVYSLTDYSITNVPKFVGLKNYIHLFNGEDIFFYKSLLVTTYYVVLSVPAGIMFSFGIAMLMNRRIKYRSLFRAIFFLPSIMPISAACMIWAWLLNPNTGVANYILGQLNIPPAQWFSSEAGVVPSIALIATWMTGNTMVIFLAALQGIPSHLYEAIDVDGGNSFHKIVHITIPMMTPTIFFNLIMALINGFQVFVPAYIISSGQGGPNNSSLFYGLYLYREAFKFSNMGAACAIAWVLFLIIMMINLIIFKSSNSWVYYESKGEKKK